MIEIDGSFGEGGGQILRTSLTLSLLTGQAVRLSRIRAKRSKPGLQPQHLMSVRAAAAIGNARLTGDAVSSTEITFHPGTVQPGSYHFPIGTAGSIGLVIHTLYLPLALAGGESEVVIEGGTHVATSPCFHFLDVTWRAYLEQMGFDLRLTMDRPGFYPRGGGRVRLRIGPTTKVRSLHLTRPVEHVAVKGFSAVAGLPNHVAQRQAQRVQQRLNSIGIATQWTLEHWPGGPGSVVAVQCLNTPVPTLFFALGERGKPAEAVGDACADAAIRFMESQQPVDAHSADQILLPLCFAEQASEYAVAEVTQHLLTNAAVIQRFLRRDIHIAGDEGTSGVVKIGPPC